MIWKEIDLFNIAKDIKPLVSGNEMFLDLSNVEANGHRENVDNRKVECIRAMGGGIGLDSIEKVLLSLDNINYETVDLKDRLELDEQGRLEINLHEDYKVKYIRLIWNSRIPVQNIQIEVLNRKFVGLVFAAANAGWGDRMLSFLEAMNLAERFGWKFAFRWREGSLLSNIPNITNTKIKDKEYIFSKNFIDKYHYDKILVSPYGDKHRISSKNMKKSYYWGACPWLFPDEIGVKACPDIWKKIEFSDEIKNLILETKKIIENFKKQTKKEYISFNVRNGDSVYLKHWFEIYACPGKVMPIEVAMEAICRFKDKVVILFSEDIEAIRNIKQYFKNINIDVYIGQDDILPKQDNETKKALQEITFISSGEVLDAGWSGFGRLPSLIGNGKEPTFISQIFTLQEQLDAIEQNFNKINVSKELKGFSKIRSYELYRELHPDDWSGMSRYLSEAIDSFSENVLYYWLLAECYQKLGDSQKANNILKDILLKWHIDDVARSFLYCDLRKNTLKNTFPFVKELLERVQQKEKEIRTANAAIQSRDTEIKTIKNLLSNKDKQAQSAKNRIENHLAYKLGEAIIENSKSFLGIIRIPFVLSYISQSHHKKLANQKEQLPKIETLPDYKEAIKIKEQMTYKLGEAWIKCYKTWYKGGLIKFYFEAQKIKKEHKNKENK